MLFSMTGFGRSITDTHLGQLVVEILSVNRKYLEMHVSIPKEFSRFEIEVRKWVGEKLSRGQISIRINLILSSKSAGESLPDREVMRELKKGWEKIAEALHLDPKAIDLSFLAQNLPQSTRISYADEKDLPFLQKGVESALAALQEMKKVEGKALSLDIGSRLKEMEKTLVSIEELSPRSTLMMREKLMKKMEELLAPGTETDERLFREIALFAEKVDISEEITRLRSHFEQFIKLFDPKGASVGRKMDFLVQEMGREINTIGSKASEAKISHFVVDMKSELEKIREQIQNIE